MDDERFPGFDLLRSGNFAFFFFSVLFCFVLFCFVLVWFGLVWFCFSFVSLFILFCIVVVGACQERLLVTGEHVVADLTCAVCGAVVGWKYVRKKC